MVDNIVKSIMSNVSKQTYSQSLGIGNVDDRFGCTASTVLVSKHKALPESTLVEAYLHVQDIKMHIFIRE